jgi:hypothetical protein
MAAWSLNDVSVLLLGELWPRMDEVSETGDRPVTMADGAFIVSEGGLGMGFAIGESRLLSVVVRCLFVCGKRHSDVLDGDGRGRGRGKKVQSVNQSLTGNRTGLRTAVCVVAARLPTRISLALST